MKRTLFVMHRPTGLYGVGSLEGGNIVSFGAKREDADLYNTAEVEEIKRGAVNPSHVVAVEATATEYMRYIGRLGGRTMTPARVKANKKRARHKRTRKEAV
jgi:hypothetical protein